MTKKLESVNISVVENGYIICLELCEKDEDNSGSYTYSCEKKFVAMHEVEVAKIVDEVLKGAYDDE